MTRGPKVALVGRAPADLAEQAARSELARILEQHGFETVTSTEAPPNVETAIHRQPPATRTSTASRMAVLASAAVGGGTEIPPDLCFVSADTTSGARSLGSVPAYLAPHAATGLARERPSRPKRQNAVAIEVTPEALATNAPWHEVLYRLARHDTLHVTLGLDETAAAARRRFLVGSGCGRAVDTPTASSAVKLFADCRLVIGFSFASVLFAFLANAPFVAYRRAPGVAEYLEDRGLDAWLFEDIDELIARAEQVLIASPDFTPILDRDLTRHDEHLDLAARSLSTDGSSDLPSDPWAPGTTPRYRFDGSRPAEGTDVADANVHEYVERVEEFTLGLHREIADQCARIDDLAAEVDRAHGEYVRLHEAHTTVRRELDAIRTTFWFRLASRLSRALDTIRGAS